MPKKKTIQAEQFELPTIADHLNESDTQVPSEQAAESDYSQADIDAAHARAFQIYKTFSGKDFSSGTYKKKSPARLRVTKDGPPLTLRKKVSVSGASTPPAVRKPRHNKSASSSSTSQPISPKAIMTSTPDQRITRLLAEGATILAAQGSTPGIDITHDIVGLLELARSASDDLGCAAGPAEDR